MRQTPDLPQSSQHHIHGKRILSCLGGHLALSSWSESVQGWLTTIRHGLHTTAPAMLKSIPGDTESTRPGCSQMLCFPGPSSMKIYLCNYTAAWGAGNPQGKWERVSLQPPLWAGRGLCVRGLWRVEGSYEGDLTHRQRWAWGLALEVEMLSFTRQEHPGPSLEVLQS